MIRRERGFTLVELMITMVIFVLVIAAASNIFSGLLNQFKQQSKIAETNIEGIVGLEMLRTDLQQAGFGVPWNVELTGDESGDDDWVVLAGNYTEAFSNGGGSADPLDATYYNDGAPASAVPIPSQRRAPRPILAENSAGPLMGAGANTWRSDYFVVKATSIATNGAAQAWTHVTNEGAANVVRTWNAAGEDLAGANRVIVLRSAMGVASAQQRVLMTNSAAAPPVLFTTFTEASDNDQDVFEPGLDTAHTHLIYGVDQNRDLRMPFNRADYYVESSGEIPARCAQNTGVLFKAVLAQGAASAAGQFGAPLPLLDCVADMQVVFITDVNNDGIVEWNNADWPFSGGLSSQQLRDQLREVRIYILAHEGQKDTSFTFNNFSTGCAGVANCLRVGDRDPLNNVMGREFNLSWIGSDFANYRWKVYTMSVQLPNLR